MPHSLSPPGVCYFYGKYPDCYNINPIFCSMCQKFLCDSCRADYSRRMKGMMSELEIFIRERVFGEQI